MLILAATDFRDAVNSDAEEETLFTEVSRSLIVFAPFWTSFAVDNIDLSTPTILLAKSSIFLLANLPLLFRSFTASIKSKVPWVGAFETFGNSFNLVNIEARLLSAS